MWARPNNRAFAARISALSISFGQNEFPTQIQISSQVSEPGFRQP